MQRRATILRGALSALALTTLLAASPLSARAGVLPVGVELNAEWSHSWFGSLATYTRFEDSGGPRSEERRIGFDDTWLRGFRLGLSPHRDVEVAWTHLWGTSNYEVEVDGVEQIHGDDSNGPAILLARLDMEFDLISLRLRPEALELGPVRPVFGLGFGWVLQSQQNRFRPPDSLPVDYSDSDKALEATVALEARWRWLQGGMQLRSVHWRFDTEDPRIPSEATHSWQLGIYFGGSL